MKGAGGVMGWIFLNAFLAANHAGFLILLTTAGLGWYAVHCARASRRAVLPPSAAPRPVAPAAGMNGVRALFASVAIGLVVMIAACGGSWCLRRGALPGIITGPGFSSGMPAERRVDHKRCS